MSDIGKLFLKKWPWKCQIGFDLSVQKCCKHHIMIFFFFFFLLGAVELFNFPDFVTDRRKCKIESRAGCLEKKPVFCWYCRYYFAAFYDQASWSRTSNSWVIFFFFFAPLEYFSTIAQVCCQESNSGKSEIKALALRWESWGLHELKTPQDVNLVR